MRVAKFVPTDITETLPALQERFSYASYATVMETPTRMPLETATERQASA